jgi:hypothetical protein
MDGLARPKLPVIPSSRLDLIRSVLAPGSNTELFITRVRDLGFIPDGDTLLPPDELNRAVLAHGLGDVVGDDGDIIREVMKNRNILTVRDAAFHLGPQEVDDLAKKMLKDGRPMLPVKDVLSGLFQREPAGVIHRMVELKQVSESRRHLQNARGRC